MFRKNYFTFLLAVALFLISSVVVLAQNAPVNGRIELKKADGTTEPVPGAIIEVFRTDIKAKLPAGKSDKKGNFAFAGLPLGTKIAFSISAPNISPEIYPNVKPGTQNMVITVSPGDGKQLTEAEVRQWLSNPATSGAVETPVAELTAEQKKKRAEDEKKIAEVTAKNDKVLKTNEIVNASLKEGGAAYEAKNYDLAITKFEEGYNADPMFAGSAPVLLNNKALALINRGTDTYNKSVKADEQGKKLARESAKKDFSEVVIASDKVLEILKTATTTDANVQKGYEANKMTALINRKNAYRLMAQTGVDREKGKEAQVAFQEYLAAETDPVKKSKVQLDLALTLQDSNEFELAIVEFQKILETEPTNADALVGLGLSMVNVGYINLDSNPAKGKEQLQEAANYLQKFVDIAPDTHKFKQDAKDTINSLKDQQKVTPQKVKTTTKTTTTTKKKN